MNPHLWWFHGKMLVKIPEAFGLWVCHPRRCRCQSPWLSINLESSQYKEKKTSHKSSSTPMPDIWVSNAKQISHPRRLAYCFPCPTHIHEIGTLLMQSIYLFGPLTINLILKRTDYWLAKLIDWFAISNFLPFIIPISCLWVLHGNY
jgi:hypothetical protein